MADAFQPDPLAFQIGAFQIETSVIVPPDPIPPVEHGSVATPVGWESQVGVWRVGDDTRKRTGKRYRIYH